MRDLPQCGCCNPPGVYYCDYKCVIMKKALAERDAAALSESRSLLEGE